MAEPEILSMVFKNNFFYKYVECYLFNLVIVQWTIPTVVTIKYKQSSLFLSFFFWCIDFI